MLLTSPKELHKEIFYLFAQRHLIDYSKLRYIGTLRTDLKESMSFYILNHRKQIMSTPYNSNNTISSMLSMNTVPVVYSNKCPYKYYLATGHIALCAPRHSSTIAQQNQTSPNITT